MALNNASLKIIEKELRNMNTRHKLFALVRDEMKRRGHWKAKPRGKPFKKSKRVA